MTSIWSILRGIVFSFFVVSLYCQEASPHFCAVKIEIQSLSGEDTDGLEVRLLNADGERVATSFVRDGTATFCDFGFGKHSVRIDTPYHHSVSIHDIELEPGKTQLFKVVLSVRLSYQASGGNACMAYLRVLSTDRKPIQRPVVAFAPEFDYRVIGDEYGRAIFLVPLELKSRVVIYSRSHKPREVRLECPDGPGSRISEEIILNK